ncbi:MAG: tetratricopeptide repeat protein, partial [Candidatus Levybacteria bacterium]|nr:tetratricopeptide repeat protein [Candidatus Levybacteria bacterium]
MSTRKYRNASNYLNLANILLNDGNYDSAIYYYIREAIMDPNDPIIFNNLGVAHYHLENHKEAIIAYKYAISKDADYIEPVFNLAKLLQNLERLPEATKYFKKVITLDKSHFSSYVGLAQSLSGVGKVKEALSAYKMALELKPKDFTSMQEIASLYIMLKDY